MGRMRIGKTFYFDASHFLPGYEGDCAQVHGHTYTLEVVIEGDIKSDGMIIDYRDLDRNVQAIVLDKIDHRDLNQFFAAPTAENIALWIFHELEKEIPVCSVRLFEGVGKWASVEKEKE